MLAIAGGIILAWFAIAVIAGIAQDNPGCALSIVGLIAMIGLAKCVF